MDKYVVSVPLIDLPKTGRVDLSKFLQSGYIVYGRYGPDEIIASNLMGYMAECVVGYPLLAEIHDEDPDNRVASVTFKLNKNANAIRLITDSSKHAGRVTNDFGGWQRKKDLFSIEYIGLMPLEANDPSPAVLRKLGRAAPGASAK